MITSIMTMIINAITIMMMLTGFTIMTIIMKKITSRKLLWLPRTYTYIATLIIVMKWRVIIAIMIVAMTTITTMTMLIIKQLQAYQRGTSSISTKSMEILILKEFHSLKPSKLR